MKQGDTIMRDGFDIQTFEVVEGAYPKWFPPGTYWTLKRPDGAWIAYPTRAEAVAAMMDF